MELTVLKYYHIPLWYAAIHPHSSTCWCTPLTLHFEVCKRGKKNYKDVLGWSFDIQPIELYKTDYLCIWLSPKTDFWFSLLISDIIVWSLDINSVSRNLNLQLFRVKVHNTKCHY